MKIGVCINMNPPSTYSSEQTGIDNIPLYRQAGFDYLEVPGGALMTRPENERRRLEEQILAGGMPCRAINSLFHPTLRLTGDNVDRSAVDAYIDGACVMAARLGVRYLVFGSPGSRNVPMGFSREKALEQIIDTAKRLADRAGKDDMFAVIEHVNHLEGNILGTFRESVELTERLNHPHIRGFVDYYHLALGNENLDLMRKKISLIEHAHHANLLGRTVPVANRHEEGGVAFMKTLKESGYAGGVSVEGFTRDMNEFADCAAFLKQFA